MFDPFGILNIRQSDVTNKNPEGVMINPSLARRRGEIRPRHKSSTAAMWRGVAHQRLMENFRIAACAFGGSPSALGPENSACLAGLTEHVPKRLRHASNPIDPGL
jgi:hypothetical protein